MLAVNDVDIRRGFRIATQNLGNSSLGQMLTDGIAKNLDMNQVVNGLFKLVVGETVFRLFPVALQV